MAAIHTFTVRAKIDEGQNARLVRGTRREVEAFLISELAIEPATVEQAVKLGAKGVEIEEAGTT